MSNLQIENLWQYIQALSLSKRNKKWLADRLIESMEPSVDAKSVTLAAIQEAKEGKVTSFGSFDDFKKYMDEL